MKKHYVEHGSGFLAEVMDLPYGTINAAAWRMRLKVNSPQAESHRFRWRNDFHDPLLAEAHAAGKTMKDVASMLGTSTVTVAKHARRLGLSFRYKRGRIDTT